MHSREQAETLALRCLEWLAGNDELLPVFMGSTGVNEDDMRERAGDPEFLASILDFLLMDDTWVVGFCEDNSLSFDVPMKARTALPGGGVVNWT